MDYPTLRSQFLDFNVLSTAQGHLRTILSQYVPMCRMCVVVVGYFLVVVVGYFLIHLNRFHRKKNCSTLRSQNRALSMKSNTMNLLHQSWNQRRTRTTPERPAMDCSPKTSVSQRSPSSPRYRGLEYSFAWINLPEESENYNEQGKRLFHPPWWKRISRDHLDVTHTYVR